MKVAFTESAYKDFEYWKQHDPKKIERIQKICKDISKHPHSGIGKPEPLKYDLQGCWSRRIDRTHRLVYTVCNKKIIIISCRHHY